MKLPGSGMRRGVKQFIKFAIVGLSGTIVNFVIYHSLLHYHVHIWLSYAVGFITGGINNYWWNRHWTFRSKAAMGKELGQFISVSAVSLALSEVVIVYAEHLLPRDLHHRNSVTWLLAIAVGTAWNFFINKYWTFRHVHHHRADQAT